MYVYILTSVLYDPSIMGDDEYLALKERRIEGAYKNYEDACARQNILEQKEARMHQLHPEYTEQTSYDVEEYNVLENC